MAATERGISGIDRKEDAVKMVVFSLPFILDLLLDKEGTQSPTALLVALEYLFTEPEPKNYQAIRLQNYAEQVVPNNFEDDFKRHFRMTRTAFEKLVNVIEGTKELDAYHAGIENIEIPKQCMIFLWYTVTQRHIGQCQTDLM